MNSNTITSSTSLTQEELDGYWRQDFVKQVLEGLTSGQVRFLAIKDHTNLVTITKKAMLFDFTIGPKSFYTYKLSEMCSFLEQLYDEFTIKPLHGELQVNAAHLIASPE